jgi:flavin reductase (DIM6/NTAB) family NADH-FMN oxidoreductase RutF
MSQRINPEQLKEVMRAWITGVAIITGSFAGQSHGMTANSFTSIALSPPTVMVVLAQGTRTHNLVISGHAFGVTILDVAQKELGRRFAGQVDVSQPRFEGLETFTLVTGVPLIKGGLAYLDCQVAHSFDIGRTTVFLGEVLATQKDPKGRSPLLYFNRHWRKLAGR